MKIVTKKVYSVHYGDTLICDYAIAPIVALLILLIVLSATLFINKAFANNKYYNYPVYEVFDANTTKWTQVKIKNIKENTIIRIWKTNKELKNYHGCISILIGSDSFINQDGSWSIFPVECADDLIKLYE